MTQEKTTDTPRIYVASLSDYNAGRLLGRWIDANQSAEELHAAIREMLAESREPLAEEWAIHDYEGFGSLGLSEFASMDDIAAVAKGIEEHGPLFAELTMHFGGLSGLEEARKYMEEGYRGEFDSLLAAAPELFEALELADACLGLVAGANYNNSELCRDIRDVISKVLEHDYAAEREPSIQDQNLYWGRCPQCQQSDGYLSIGRVHWFYCEAHRVKWWSGENLFSSWQADTEEDRKQNAAFLRDFEEIEPD